MNESIDLSNLTPVEHDLLYMERLWQATLAAVKFDDICRTLIWQEGKYVTVKDGRYGKAVYVHPSTSPLPTTIDDVVPFTAEDAIRIIDAKGADDRGYAAAKQALIDAKALVTDCDVEYCRRAWARFWLVTSSDGHIHSSTSCSTCNKGKEPTGFALVPYLSGASVTDAVADLGAALCSVCFPDAPVESREQVKISARVALILAEQGVDAFQQARAKAQADAQKRASDRCSGSGEPTVKQDGRHWCSVCGGWQRDSGKARPHRRPRFYAVKRNWKNYNDGWWNGTSWAPSTKKVDLLTREAAQAIVDAHGGDLVRSE